MTTKSMGYSQDSMLIIMSSSIPSSRTMEVYASYNRVVVGLMKYCRFKGNMVSFFITLILAPKSIMLLGIGFLLMITLTT